MEDMLVSRQKHMFKFINEINILIGLKMIKNHTRYTKKLEIKPEKTSKNLNIER